MWSKCSVELFIAPQFVFLPFTQKCIYSFCIYFVYIYIFLCIYSFCSKVFLHINIYYNLYISCKLMASAIFLFFTAMWNKLAINQRKYIFSLCLGHKPKNYISESWHTLLSTSVNVAKLSASICNMWTFCFPIFAFRDLIFRV